MKKLVKIELKTETLDLLMSLGRKNESIESIISKLLEKWTQKYDKVDGREPLCFS